MSDYVNELNAENFAAAVASELPVLIDFWAPWCGPCKALGPTIEKIGEETVGKAKICKVNIDDAIDLASKFEIDTIPTVLIFKGGEIVKKFVGVQTKATLISALLD